MWNTEDIEYMQRALTLAERGRNLTNPNPMVGAVIVRDGRILAEGWHRAYGLLHAEREALASCTEDPAGATMYVTLEPCCHHGKQPPCTDAILQAGIVRVVVAMQDPNPLVAGHGLEILRTHGVEVQTGLLEEEAAALNRVFLKYITTGRPWTVFKSAMTLDGRIAAATGDSKWVSCEQSRDVVHGLRGGCMGVVVGIGTVLADDPMLNCRIEGMRQPLRIVVDSTASLPLTSRLVATAGEFPTMVVHTDAAPQSSLEALRSRGVQTLECPAKEQKVDVAAMLQALGRQKVDSLLLEGGSELAWSFVQGGHVDEYYIFVAPKIVGGRSAKGPVGGEGFAFMRDAKQVEIDAVTPSGTDWLIHGFSKQ